MQDKPLFDLENEFETNLIDAVLTDLEIPHRIVTSEGTYFGILFGSGVVGLKGFGQLWGYVEDEEKIKKLLDEVRASQPMEDIDELADNCEPSEELIEELAILAEGEFEDEEEEEEEDGWR
jgi:hypothetical protein